MTHSTAPIPSLSPADTPTHWQALLGHIAAAHSRDTGTRTLVLLPFVQLLPAAKQHWLAQQAGGLMPRFETSSTWAASLPPVALGAQDFRQNMAHDSLQARALLAQSPSTKGRIEALYTPLLELCAELAPLAASCPPAERMAWGQHWQNELPSLLPAGEFLNTERHLQATAAIWLGYSSFASDVLFSPHAGAQFEQLIVVQGLHPDPLSLSLAAFWQAQGKTVLHLPFAPPLSMEAALPPSPEIAPTLYACADGQNLLAHSALQVLQLLEQGRKPVALIAQDRHATRQLRAMLEAQGARIKDDTGWKLSTTHAASRLLVLVEAALQPHNNAAQLAWLKASLPAQDPGLAQLQQLLARAYCPLAQTAAARKTLQALAGRHSSAQQLDALFAMLDSLAQLHGILPSGSPMPIQQWQERLTQALALHQQDAQLAQDEAGAQILRLLQQSYSHQRPLSLAAFVAWLRDVLENAHFLSPSAPQQPDVVLLPLAQMLGRSFAATVWPGVDAQRLPLLPKQKSSLSRAQRSALGLPSPEALAAAQQQAFLLTMQQAPICLLWQTLDGEQTLAPSPLLQAWQLAQGVSTSPLPALPLESRAAHAVAAPQAQAGALRLPHISASAYEALRRCPYQFFSRRLLGLQAADELEQDPDQSDWGQFVHATLLAFHQARQTQPECDQQALLHSSAQTQMQRLAAELGSSSAHLLLPYRHSWPTLAANYLAWLAQDEALGWTFVQGEFMPEERRALALNAPEAPLPLTGSIDRLDQNSTGQLRVLDYKTARAGKLKTQVKNPYEDTQLPFYALLLGEQASQLSQACYLSVNDREAISTVAQNAWQDAAAALEQGIRQDLDRIYAGAAMPALGSEEGACQYCEARGLCRKGQWAD